MAVLSSILGGATFGLLTRFWQLGIQKKPLFDCKPCMLSCSAKDTLIFILPNNIDLPAHASYVVGFAVLGYYADVWEKHSGELIAQKRELIRRNRIKLAEEAEKAEMNAKA